MIPQDSVHLHKRVPYSLVACFLLLLGATSNPTQTFSQRNDTKVTPRVGDRARDFSSRDFNGNTFTLSKVLKERSVLLWFTNLCEGCQSKIAQVQELKSLYETKGVAVVAVSVLGKDRKTVEDVIRNNNVTFQFLYDPKGEATGRYSGRYVEGTCPLKNIFIVNKNGKITYANHLPGVAEKELLSRLEETIKGVQR
jgi:peroxiredoxin